jgi:hypothetical protein
VGQLTSDQQYPVIGRSGEWWQILLDGQTAWVYSGLAKISGDASGITDLQAAPTMAAFATPLNQSEAQASIRKFLERPDLGLIFVGPAHMINSPDGDLKVWQYTDDTGRVYLVEAATSRLVQIDPPQGLTHSSVAPFYSAAELQVRAEALMTANMPEFAGLKPNLDFEASDKSNSIFFFRWNDLQATGWKMNRPFAQVALAGDGTLVSYYNTLILK